MITDYRLIQSLKNLATAAEDSHPEVAGVLLCLSGLVEKPNEIELRFLFTASCDIAERELFTQLRS